MKNPRIPDKENRVIQSFFITIFFFIQCRVLSSYESHLASIAMSSSEATLAAVDGLFELNLLTNKKITSDEEDDGEDEDDNNSEIIELEHQGAGSIEEEMSTTKQFSQPTTSAIVVS